VLLFAGCGRIGFDGALDGALCLGDGHDEDADGVDDACDVCPQLADSTQADRDGDQVGDACDPRPDDAREEIVVFDPFTTRRADWSFPGAQPVFTGDSMIGDSRTSQFRADRAGVPRDDTYTFALELGDAAPTGQRQIALYALEDVTHLYYCDLDAPAVDATYWAQSFTTDAITYQRSDLSEATGPLERGALMMTLEHEVSGWACITTWPAVKARLSSPIPSGISPVGVSLSALRVEVEVTSFLHIHSN
jgi:hypothetical protein